MFLNILNKILFSFILITVSTTTPLLAVSSQNNKVNFENNYNFYCDPQLKSHYNKIKQIPEARELIETVLKEGPLKILVDKTTRSQQFGALWNPIDRIILIDHTSLNSEGRVISSILFELHNASVTSHYDQLDALVSEGKIEKENYVQSVEYTEYLNSKNAAKIANKGIQLKIFPKTAFMPTYKDFDEHYHYQKVGGHAAWIARNYEYLKAKGNSNST